MKKKVFVSADMASVALGADALADAFVDAGCTVVRTSSRGLFSIEPLVEVTKGRRADRLRPGQGQGRRRSDSGEGRGAKPARARRGAPSVRPAAAFYLRSAAASIDPARKASRAYAAHGGLSAGLIWTMPWRWLLRRWSIAVKASGLTRARRSGAFPTGLKWQTVLDRSRPTRSSSPCNADEGDSGTFADRMLMEGDPFCLIEGMAIAAHAVGARHGYVYIRSEYPFAIQVMEHGDPALDAT